MPTDAPEASSWLAGTIPVSSAATEGVVHDAGAQARSAFQASAKMRSSCGVVGRRLP